MGNPYTSNIDRFFYDAGYYTAAAVSTAASTVATVVTLPLTATGCEDAEDATLDSDGYASSPQTPSLEAEFVYGGSPDDTSYAHELNSGTELYYRQDLDDYCEGHVTAKITIDHPNPERVIPKLWVTDNNGGVQNLTGIDQSKTTYIEYYGTAFDLSANLYATTDPKVYEFRYDPTEDDLIDSFRWSFELFFTASDSDLEADPVHWRYEIYRDSSDNACGNP